MYLTVVQKLDHSNWLFLLHDISFTKKQTVICKENVWDRQTRPYNFKPCDDSFLFYTM